MSLSTKKLESYFICRIKFGLSEKHTKFEKIFLMVNVQSTRKITQIFVCFSESPNFIRTIFNVSQASTWTIFIASFFEKTREN